jgi:endonuclease-3 related protein
MQRITKQAGIAARKFLSRYYPALCGRSGPQQWWPARSRLEVILEAILTQNTAWPDARHTVKPPKHLGRWLIGTSQMARACHPLVLHNIRLRAP